MKFSFPFVAKNIYTLALRRGSDIGIYRIYPFRAPSAGTSHVILRNLHVQLILPHAFRTVIIMLEDLFVPLRTVEL